MLMGTVFYQVLRRNLFIVVLQARCEAKIKLWVGVEAGSAQLENVSDTFGWTVFALYSIWLGRRPDEGQSEVDFVGCTLHGGYNEVSETG